MTLFVHKVDNLTTSGREIHEPRRCNHGIERMWYFNPGTHHDLYLKKRLQNGMYFYNTA